MSLMQKQALKQGQSLVMTPQLQQAIKLLTLSNIELAEFIDQECERNPLLERTSGVNERQSETIKPERADAPYSASDARGNDGDGALTASDGAWTKGASGQSAGGQGLRGHQNMALDGEDADFAESLTKPETLHEHLTRQLHLNLKKPADLLIGQHLVGMVNEHGYLTANLASLSAQLGVDVSVIVKVLNVLRGFDPIGVFAFDLKDCLGLQLKEKDRLDPAMACLLDHLDLVAKRDFAKLKSLCAVSLEDVQDMITELRALDPRPGSAFGSEPIVAVVPDVQVRAASDGSWLVELNSETLPRVLVNNQYSAKLSRRANAQDQTFISTCHNEALWLAKSLDQRAKTILKVAREIIRQQDAFLVLGVAHLRPMTMRVVAEAIEMHESTVSRVVAHKYMQTPRGTFELKYFFSNAIASGDEEDANHSSESVRQRLKSLIAAETIEAILSDEDLVTILKTENIEIARRTVAKYRESLNILSSTQRRREALSKAQN